MNESTKALRRRWCEDARGEFPWRQIFTGRMLDVGCGPDKLPFPNVVGFDSENADVVGDANKLTEYFEPESFDVISASHVLEHVFNPAEAIRDWLTLIKPGGHLVALVPDVGAYERFTYPSTYNPDHKASFSMIYHGSSFPVHYHIPTLLATFDDVATVLLARYVERNYDWTASGDQTFNESGQVEIWNEFCLKKK